MKNTLTLKKHLRKQALLCLIHYEIKKSSQIRPTLDCTSLKINEYLKDINPLLLDFLTSITITIREREISNTIEHIKKTCLYFILCQLMFCINPKSPTPIHNLIADITEVCGGSRQLIQILNRLGCASSTDTHDRFVTQHATVIILISCRVTQLFTVMTNNGVTTEQHCSLYNLILIV